MTINLNLKVGIAVGCLALLVGSENLQSQMNSIGDVADSRCDNQPQKQARTNQKQDGVRADFRFDDPNGTRLGDAVAKVGSAKWNGGLTDSHVVDGSFRIRRNSSKLVNRYLDIQPRVRLGDGGPGETTVPRGWVVLRVAGWNLRGATPNERIRFGFTSRSKESFQVAGFVIARTAPDRVSLSGLAFGDGGSDIKSSVTLAANQTTVVTFVLELDKQQGNTGKGNSGGVYRLFYRVGDSGGFQRVGRGGKVRRLRNGNQLHLSVQGFFGAKDEFFDIDRFYFTTQNPIVARR